MEGESQVCHEFNKICSLPPHPKLGCHWQAYKEIIRQCTSRAELEEWQRKGYEKMFHNIPDGHCIKKDDQCKCCCGGYVPNEEGTECVKSKESECGDWGQRTEWSQCLWFPLSKMAKDLESHCDVEKKSHPIPMEMPTPAGFHIPQKCGFCSFSVRCQKRTHKDGCFPLRIEKKACGNDDHCPHCGDICTLKKQNGTCEWTNHLLFGLWKKFEAKAKESHMPLWRHQGYSNILKYLPKAECKAVGDDCKCCCHPYEPNADGTACVPKGYCKSPKELQHH
ncbi:unnamed protein product [Soboliphyme baturini]|uniref:VWFC domain-containing protein n=1 Tax=Soboliphyme baturini TaxID=241478 RepID=A0A183J109_9BILA|nr:unnamed protein product [Soboliphyme baturini]